MAEGLPDHRVAFQSEERASSGVRKHDTMRAVEDDDAVGGAREEQPALGLGSVRVAQLHEQTPKLVLAVDRLAKAGEIVVGDGDCPRQLARELAGLLPE